MLLDDIATYLTAMGATSTLWPIWKSDLPDETDQGIALFETGGFPPDTLGRENEDVTFQVRVRGTRKDYQVARAKWQEVYDLLQDAQQTAGSPVLLPGYVFIQAMHAGAMGWNDAKGRPNLTANFRVKKARS
jgi:Bacteriophage minor capsid protein